MRVIERHELWVFDDDLKRKLGLPKRVRLDDVVVEKRDNGTVFKIVVKVLYRDRWTK